MTANTGIPWAQIISGVLMAIVVVIPVTWWLVTKIEKLQDSFNNLVSGATQTADGKAITIINGVQDEKLKEIHSLAEAAIELAKTGHSRIDRLEENQKKFDKAITMFEDKVSKFDDKISKFDDGNSKLQQTYLALLERAGELIASTQIDRDATREMFSCIANALDIEIKK